MKFRYELSNQANIRIRIFDTNFELIKTIERLIGQQGTSTGENIIEWDGINKYGEKIAAGIYFYMIEAIDVKGNKNINIFAEENAAEFFIKATGVRQIALGSTFIGIADDINTILFNPAGLSTIKYPQITWLRTRLSPFDTTTDFTLGALPVGIGMGILNNKISEIQITDDKGNPKGKLSFKPDFQNYF